MPQEREWIANAFDTVARFPSYTFTPTTDVGFCVGQESTSSLLESQVAWPRSENSEWVCPNQGVANILVELFRQVPQVKWVCAQFGPEEISVWTLLETYDRGAREKVYGKEMDLCKALGIYDFDFRVTSEEIVSPKELESTGWHVIYKRP